MPEVWKEKHTKLCIAFKSKGHQFYLKISLLELVQIQIYFFTYVNYGSKNSKFNH